MDDDYNWLKLITSSTDSFCPQHEWKVRDFTPGKYSVFSAQEDQSCGQDEEEGDVEGKLERDREEDREEEGVVV